MPANIVSGPVQADAVDRLSLAVADARSDAGPSVACMQACQCMAEE